MPGLLTPVDTTSLRIGVYANASARDASVTSPYTGLQIYLEDIDKVQFWNGISWQIVNQDLPEVIPSYADPSARDSALPSPSEGDVIYIQSLKTLQVYNGTTWTEVSGGGNPLFLAGT
jgi:hypothetical protein